MVCKYFCICLTLVCLSLHSRAQIGEFYDIDACVVLGDGSSILGKLIHRDRHSVILRLSTGDTLEFEYGYIKRFRGGDDRMEIHQRGNYQYVKGDFINLSISFASSDLNPSSHTHLLAARRLDRSLAAGFGLGLDTYQGGITQDSYSYLALYGYGRVYLNKHRRRNRFFISSTLGYGMAENVVDQWGIQDGTYRGRNYRKARHGITLCFQEQT